MVGRIHDTLKGRLDLFDVFLDEHAIPPGADFREVIASRMADADVVLVLMGPQWLDLLNARASDTSDFVRFEIETALVSKMRVVPILVAGAQLPSADQLPETMKALIYRNGVEIDSGRHFHDQMKALLLDLAGEGPANAGRRALLIAAAALPIAGGLAWWRVTKVNYPKEVSILIIMGEGVAYEEAMADAFIDHLRVGLRDRGIAFRLHQKVQPKFEGNYASPTSEAGRRTWDKVKQDIKNSYPAGAVDYFVTLGTFASQAIKEKVFEPGVKGMIYLGVTDPYRAQLAGEYKIAGVRYGTGGLDYGRKVAELFPEEQKLVFIYEKDSIQDGSVAADLEKLNSEFALRSPQSKRPRFELRPIDGSIEITSLKLADFLNPTESEVYFAWYGLDNVLNHQVLSSLYDPHLWIIPSTYSPRNLNLAGIVITVDDALVGRLGADIILKQLDNPGLDLSKEKVGAPAFRTFIKESRVRQKQIKIVETAFSRKPNEGYTVEK